jgi:WD40 repeat protein
VLDTTGTNTLTRILKGTGAEKLQRTSYSSDGQLMVTASDETNASIWSVQSAALLRVLPHPDKVFCANFSPDNSRIVTACRDNLVRVWDTASGQATLVITGHVGPVMFAGYSPNGERIISSSKDGTARIWRAADGARLGRPFEHGSWVGYASMSPDGSILVTAGYEHKARIWDTASGRRIQADLNHKAAVTSVEVSADGRLILTASLDSTACVWSLEKALPLLVLRHTAGVTRAAFATDGRRVITACADGSVRIWDLAGSATPPLLSLGGISGDGSRFIMGSPDNFQVFDTLSSKAVSPVVRLPSGQRFARTDLSHDGRFVLAVVKPEGRNELSLVQVWSVAGGKALSPGVPSLNPGAIRCSSDGRRLLIWADSNTLQAWNTLTLKPLTPALTYDDGISAAVFSPDGAYLAISFRAFVQVWDLATGKMFFPALLHNRPVGRIQFSGDGRLLVACCLDNQVRKCSARLWDARTGRPVGDQLQQKDGILDACFSPDSRQVATAGEDFSAIIWDTRTCRQITPALWHNDQVQSVAFAPSGRWALTASSDATARIWNAKSGEAVTLPLRHVYGLQSATFLADERHIVTTDALQQSWLWELQVDGRPVEDLLALARLMSAEAADVTVESNPESMASSWESLRSRYPADFTISEAEIIAWHAEQAHESEDARIWSSVVFHLEALQRLTPNDRALADRLAKAKARLASAN